MLDDGEVPYRVQAVGKSLGCQKLLLLNGKGLPVKASMHASKGQVRLASHQSLFMTGVFRIPFLFWSFSFGLAVFLVFTFLPRSLYDPGITIVELLAIGLALVVAAICNCWRSLPKLESDLRAFAGKLQRQNPNPVPCDRGASRAILAAELWRLHDTFVGFLSGRHMYYVCENLVLPLTAHVQLSYAEVVGPVPMQWFVSHFWGTAFNHFVNAVRRHAERSAVSPAKWTEVSYWICTFSNNQWKVDDELGSSWQNSSFYLALRSGLCKGTAMIFDDDAMPLSRAWCLFELLQTSILAREDSSFQGLLLCTDSGVLNDGCSNIEVALTISKRLSTLRLQDATASRWADKKMIDQLVGEQPGGFEGVNKFLKDAVQVVLHEAQVRFEQDLKHLKQLNSKSCVQQSSTGLQPSSSSESMRIGAADDNV